MDPIDVTSLSPEIYAGPFHERQKQAGGSFYEDMGALWTRGFSDPVSEYWAVRRDVALWDVSSLVKFRFTGPDARLALDRLSTRRMADAEPGVVRYGMILDERGMMLDEATLLVVSPEETYLFGNDERGGFVSHLVMETGDLDVDVADVTQLVPNIAIQGPRSFEVVSALAGTDVSSLKWFRLVPEPVELAGVSGLVVRAGFTGELGYEFYLTSGPAGAEAVWDAVIAQGATPIGLDGIEKLRMEMGLVIQEEDYWPGITDPYELSMDAFIELEGHDFIGREACERTAQQPPRRFKTLLLEDLDEPPAHGAEVTSGTMRVGEVRSAETTPRFGTIALAVLDAPFAREGTLLKVEGRPATVHPLPIDQQGRPRSDPRSPMLAEG